MKKKILIIDDDIITLKILKKYLDEKYDVQTENAGYRFVEKMDSYEVDMILLDLEMPVVNGLQVFEEIQNNSRLKNTTVVFLSGVSDPNLVRELMQKGAAGYIIKTTPKSELLEKVDKFLAAGSKKPESQEILILEGDVRSLKSMRDTLVEAGYQVKAVRTMLEAANYSDVHDVDLIVIGRDLTGNKPQEIHDSMSALVRRRGIRTLVMEQQYFSDELLENVNRVLTD